jgi:hypothetical protein
MHTNKAIPVSVAAFFFILSLGLSGQALGPSGKDPTIDGAIGQGEYSQFNDFNGMQVGASLSQDGSILSLAIQAPTSGWVAIGMGSGFMDGAYMVLAYEADGKQAITEQIGVSHFHSPVKGTKLIKSAVHSVNGVTVLEFQVRAADFVKGGRLPLIMAYGRSPDFSSRHVRHASTTLTFTK